MLLQNLKSRVSSRTKSRIKRVLGVHPTIELLREIESGGQRLCRVAKAQCDEYARVVLGRKEYAPWLYVYTLMSDGFKEGWIPDNYYADHVIPAWKSQYGSASNLKALQCLLGLDCFPDLIYVVNGICLLPDRKVIPEARAIEYLSGYQDGVVFKADDGMQGRSVSILEQRKVRELDIASLPNGVFQRFIQSHPDLARFHPNSVATLRLTTVIDDGGQESLRAAYVRFGSGDDSHVKSASHVRVPVDLRSGCLSDTGYTTKWHRIHRHPDTSEVFGGSTIPSFEKCAALVSKAQQALPFVRCIGWDIVVDPSETPHVLEWNGAHNDIKFSEATQGPCFADLEWESLWRKRVASA